MRTAWRNIGCWMMAAFGLAMLSPAQAHAGGGATPVEAAPIAVARTQQFDLVASGSGRTYRIFVAVPDRPAPADGYGVLYVLDGNAMFLTATEAVRALGRRPDVPRDPATVVVGIGYPDGVDVGVERTFDLTPPGAGDPRVKAATGGADAFLDFIEQDLKPRIAATVPVDPRRQGLFGHSFGGLFVLYSLATKPDAFAYRTAASPSVWFAPSILERLQAMVAARTGDSTPLKVLLTAGEYEQRLSPVARYQDSAARVAQSLRERGQVDNARKAAAILAQATGIRARFDEIAGEDHGTVIPAAISRAVWHQLVPLPVPPVPSAAAYLAMSPQERYDLRLYVRELPDADRIPWLASLKQTLHDGLSKAQVEALHAERNAMDAEQGTRPHALNAP